MSKERCSPLEVNLGKNCRWWNLVNNYFCNYPKAEVEGRTSCEGIIDDVCLFLLRGRIPASLTIDEQRIIRTTPPTKESKQLLPPGNIR